MAFNDLQITAYRAFEGVHLEEMGRMCLIVGGNNAGKSSILEAAGLILRPFDPGQWVQTAMNRDLSASLVASLWSVFPAASVLRLEDGPLVSQPLHLEATINAKLRSLTVTASANLGWDARGSAAPALSLSADLKEPGSQLRHAMEFQSSPTAARGAGAQPHRVFTVTPATHRSTRVLVEHLSRVIDMGKKSLALDLLRVFDPEVADIDVSQEYDRDGIRVTHTVRGIVDLSSFGDGMRRSAAIALALTRAEGGVILIDELEGGIHPRALRDVTARLLDAAKKASVQILATTHSLEAIDAVLDVVESTGLDDVVGYHLRRDGKRHHVRRYDTKKLVLLREGGLDLR
jgi:ABC-type lipoprotein export system ATPase subunit